MIEIFSFVILHVYHIAVVMFVLKEFGVIDSFFPKPKPKKSKKKKSDEDEIAKPEGGLNDIMNSMAPMMQNLMQSLQQPPATQVQIKSVAENEDSDEPVASAQELEDALDDE